MASSVETVIRNNVTKGIMKVVAFNRTRPRLGSKENTFLTGIHEPVDSELTLEDLKVTGKIPPALDGRYLRIGPNPVSPPNPATYHWFSGDGMIHGVRLKAGKALWYRNRWVRSKAVSAALGEQDAPGTRHGTQDNANTNVIGHNGNTWALVEAGAFPVRLNDELDTLAHDPFGGTLKGAFSAHPHLDPATGEMHAITYYAMDPTTIHHTVVDASGKVIREEPITVEHGPSIHDCAVTKQYVVIMDLPVTFSMKTLLDGQSFPYRWNPAHKARIGLMPRHGTNDDVIWCDIEPCYVFHPCNAYETEDGTVIMDVSVHNTMFADSKQGPDSEKVTFERWIIDPAAHTVTRTTLDESPQEFPRPDERFTGQKYRYAYTMALPEDHGFQVFDQTKLFKHDLETGTREVHDFGPGRVPGEFVFVPRSDDALEGDGWLMGYVIDTNTDTTDLAILDATNFTAPPVALVHVPHRIPPGFHGNWAPAT
jgi:8'-apo-carotenoid 13,14-cleaving dioxygenase